MILGVAQLVFNVEDLDTASAPYEADGWSQTFTVRDLPNHDAKASLQSCERTALDMVHLRPPAGGTAAEFTQYAGPPPGGDTVYTPRPDHLEVAAATPTDSRSFWGLLGFSDHGEGRWRNRAMIPDWTLSIRIEDAPGRSRPATTVDASGCVLVTMLTTALDRDRAQLEESGLVLRSTPSWTEQIADRATSVAIVEGPSGELVELLQAPKAG